VVALSLCSGSFGQNGTTTCDDEIELSLYNNVLTNYTCVEANYTCPDMCQQGFDEFFQLCDGQMSFNPSTNDQVAIDDTYIATLSVLIDGPCANIPLAYVIAKNQSSLDCQDWLALDLASTTLACIDKCTVTCEQIIDNVVSMCSGTDDSETVEFLNNNIGVNRSAECTDYITSKGYTSLMGSAIPGDSGLTGTPAPSDGGASPTSSVESAPSTVPPSPTSSIGSAPTGLPLPSTSVVAPVMDVSKLWLGSLASLYVWFSL